MLFLIIATSIAAIAGLVWMYWDYLRCHKTWKWVRKIESAETDQATVACGQPDISWYWWGRRSLLRKKRQTRATQKFRAAWQREQAREFRISFEKLTEPYERAKAILQAIRCKFPYDLAFGLTKTEVAQQFTDDATTILSRAESGDQLAMHDFTQIVDAVAQESYYKDYGIVQPTYPDNWDDLVIKFIPSPAVSDFKNVRELTVGEVRLKAAEALRNHDRKLAKLVLAYCLIEREIIGESSYNRYGSSRSKQVVWPHREAIGDILVAQLIVMVEAMEGSSVYSQTITLKKNE